MKEKIQKYWSSKLIIIIILMIPLLYFALFEFKLDNDFWFLINTGKNILNEGFVRIEPFSMHQGFSYISQQWLTSVIFYIIYNSFSIYGIFFLVVFINILIVFLLYKLLKLITGNKVKVSVIFTLIIDLILLFYFVTTRPQLFDIVFFILELYILELFMVNKHKKCLLFLPMISLLLINFHASIWLMFFSFMLPYVIEGSYNYFKFKKNYQIKPLLFIILISFLLGLVNPYGIDAIEYLFNSYGIDYINKIVFEMNPLVISNNLILYVYIFLILFSFYYNKNKNLLRYFLLFLGTVYLGLSHFKGMIFLIISSILPLGYNFKELFKEDKKYIRHNGYSCLIYAEIIIIMLVFFGLNISFSSQELEFEKVVKFLDSELEKEKFDKNALDLYVGYNDGGYLEYRGYRSYIDPRAEVFIKNNNKKEDIMLEYYNLQNGLLNYREFLKKYNFQYLIIEKNDIMNIYIDENDEYEKIYEYSNDKEKIIYKIYKKVKNEVD